MTSCGLRSAAGHGYHVRSEWPHRRAAVAASFGSGEVCVGRERRERGVFIAARCKRVQNRAVAGWRATRNEEQVTKREKNSFVCEGTL